MRVVSILVLAFAVSFPTGAEGQTSRRNRAEAIWKGQSAGFLITWTTSDLVATRIGSKGTPAYSARAVAEKSWAEHKADATDMRCGEDREFGIVSVVGIVVTLLDSSGGFCEGTAHPWATSRYVTIDLAQSSKDAPVPARLTDVFPERDVVTALLADKLVKSALSGSPNATPKTLLELTTALAGSPLRAGDCEFEFDDRAMTGFAFHHIEGDRVAVRVALPYRNEVCRGMITQLGLLLPIPRHLKEAIEKANDRTAGFLMKDQERVSRGLSTSFETSYGPK
jgi:hypothetical protein